MFTDLLATLSNTAHLHLLLNHVPTVGFAAAVAVLVSGRLRKSDELTRAGLALLFVVAVLSIATYVTGNAAEDVLVGTEDEPVSFAGVMPQAIRVHEDAALPAILCMEITGFFAWLALWQGRRSRLANTYFTTVLVLAGITFGLMFRAAELGGRIHHAETSEAGATPDSETETSADAAPATQTGAGWVRRFASEFVTGQKWVWATLETLHFVGLCLLFTVVLLVNLRLLGMIKSISYAALYQFLPIGMLGFGINLISGMMFFVGVPGQYVHNIMFYWKMVFIVLGGLNVLYFMLSDDVWNVKAGDDAPLGSKVAAGSAICIWAAVLFCGHMLPFIGNAF